MTMCISLPIADPVIVSLPMTSIHTEGDRFELVCTFTGIPNPEIRWEKGGSLFVIEGDRRIINSTSSSTKTSQLEIPSLLRSDAGLYTCTVTNIANTAMMSARLEVRGKIICWK